MPEENAEIVRLAYDAFNRDDWRSFVELANPDVEFNSLILEAEGSTFRGYEGVREYFAAVRAIFGDLHVEIDTIRDFGETIVVSSRGRATGSGSGVPVEQAFWQAIGMHGGKVSWWRFVRTEEEALAAAGAS